MSFTAAAWIAGIAGGLAGLATLRLTGPAHRGMVTVFEAFMFAVSGSVLALIAFSGLSLMEGMAAFFQRRASPLIPLLLTGLAMGGTLAAMAVARRRRNREDTVNDNSLSNKHLR